MRVVLMAEGEGDLGSRDARARAHVTGRLREETLGAAHILVRRLIGEQTKVPEQAVVFEAPLRPRGKTLHGSALLERENIRQALSWATPLRKPDLAIILIDADGHEAVRRRELENHVEGLAVKRVVAVAVQEFEAWLVADIKALNNVLKGNAQELADPESAAPTESKTKLAKLISDAGRSSDAPEVRRAIAGQIRLDIVEKRCPSFEHLAADIAAAVR